MVGKILDGRIASATIKNKIKQDIEMAINNGCRPPGLSVILIGTDKASEIYVNAKRKACLEVGIKSFSYNLPSETTENELIELINKLNLDKEVNGILVQLPLPSHINTDNIIEHINPHKDVDGFHPYNFGRLAKANPLMRPCTPYGIIQLLNFYNIPIAGKKTVILGASNIVGRPMALELLLAKATVTICNSKTRELEKLVRIADIIISATGIQNITESTWFNSNQVVVDVGIHRINDKICGDINFAEVQDKVAWITPVPGGVGPMTIATLLENTVRSWKLAIIK
ncbi:MAG: bifunctional methylenetetrahydrofolate dehydrogenase/methenyltetrahydrofolate cyclohydrolase [Legionellales bacterium RIFCSPHIGHO2_12_FULL_35_11]|nr:MAG: bifunctional methylenetetrahydrofolate dehydrogenase/methenyltetrahydrofolate cyclohydrolase [Legionellales bacterium RIFCSPHIGHO2_12_FULL_35_11]